MIRLPIDALPAEVEISPRFASGLPRFAAKKKAGRNTARGRQRADSKTEFMERVVFGIRFDGSDYERRCVSSGFLADNNKETVFLETPSAV